MSDPRRAALESLFVVREEDAGRMAALTLPSIPSGGWAEREDGGDRQNPYGAKARILALRDAVITEALRLIDAAKPAAPAAACTGVTAQWCPVHGDCACPEDEQRPGERTFDDPRCPLHAPTSKHAEEERAYLEAPEPAVPVGKVRALAALAIQAARYRHPKEALWAGLLDLGLARLIDADGNPIEATDDPDPDMEMTEEAKRFLDALKGGAPVEPEPGAVLAGIVRAEEHERAALVRERDEARAAAEVARRQREDAEREAADLRKALALIRDAPGKVERLTERVALLEATIADYEREARARSPEGRRREQLALFAPPAADPAGEAQRAASSGAAVAALAAAMPDAPAPKPAKVPAPVCAPCGGVPLVPAADMPREGEATGGKPLGCPACGEGYDGTPEQIARAQADSDAATKRIAKAEGKCWRCGHGIHRGRCNGSFR